MDVVKWYNIELDRQKAGKLSGFLRKFNVKYEVSRVWDLIHFEMQLRPQMLQKVVKFTDGGFNEN